MIFFSESRSFFLRKESGLKSRHCKDSKTCIKLADVNWSAPPACRPPSPNDSILCFNYKSLILRIMKYYSRDIIINRTKIYM